MYILCFTLLILSQRKIKEKIEVRIDINNIYTMSTFQNLYKAVAIFVVVLFPLYYVRGVMNCAALSMLSYNGKYSENAVVL